MDNTTTDALERIIYSLKLLSQGHTSVMEGSSTGLLPTPELSSALVMLSGELEDYKEKVSAQTAFLQEILGSIGEVIYLQQLTGDPTSDHYGFVSGRAKEIIGIGSGELERWPEKWGNAVHPDDRQLRLDSINRALQGEEVVVTYRIFHHGKSEYRWIEDRISPRLDAVGAFTQMNGSVRDVTEQQQTILDLKKTGELVTRLITSSDQVFYIVSLDKSDPFKNTFTYLSPHVENIIGYSVGDVRDDTHIWINAIHPDDLQKVTDTTKEMFRSKMPATRVYRMKHKHTNQYVWLEDYLVPIVDSDGWIREFYASARDITARRSAELEQERLVAELSMRHEELMQFSHIVSHNLRSPVASILGLAELLNAQMVPEESQQTKSYILQAAQSMDNLLRDLNKVLSVRGTLEEKKQLFSIGEVISNISINLKQEIEQTRAIINVAIDQSADELESIKSYVQSSLYNLIGNAIKYRSEHRRPVISIGVVKKQGRTVISVQDNGVGIDLQADKQRIFSLYGRLHNNRDGKGLGLYMTQTQIETLKGTIEVASEPGIGSVFTITL